MATTLHVTTSPGPILTAIARHRAAWDAYQVAPEGKPSEIACLDMQEALEALLGTPCGTRYGCLALLTHLRWWLIEEAEFADDYMPEYGLAAARASDLTLFLGRHAPTISAAAIIDLPAPPPAPIRAVHEQRLSATRPVLLALPALADRPFLGRDARVLNMLGETIAGLVLIVGGGIATALATLL